MKRRASSMVLVVLLGCPAGLQAQHTGVRVEGQRPAAPAAAPAAPGARPAAQPPMQGTVSAQAAAPEVAVDADVPATGALAIEGLEVKPGGLTAEQTARRALAASSSVGQKRAELAAANARIRQTTIQFVPRVGLRASYTRLSEVETQLGRGGSIAGAQTEGPLTTGACPMGGGTCVLDAAGDPVVAAPFGTFQFFENNYALSATLAVPISDYILRLSDAAQSAEASERAVRIAYEAEARKVASDARALYYNWLRAHAQLSITQTALSRSRARLQDARGVFEVGRLSQADVLRLEAQVANAELAVAHAESLRLLIGAQLAIIMDDDAGGDYQVGQNVPDVPAAPPVEPGEARRLIATALQQRLELEAIDALYGALRHGEDAARASAWPRLDAVGDFTYANPNPRYFPPAQEWNETWSLGLVLSMNLDEPFMADARGDEIAAEAQGALARRRGVEAAVVNEVVTAQLDIGKALAALRASETSVRAAEESYRVKTELFRVGRATTTDVLDAESELLAAKLATTNARIDLVIANERLQYAVGADVTP